MSDYVLATKYVLAEKEAVQVPVKDLNITLAWNAPVDLDLMIFGRLTNGEEFSVRTPGINQGSLTYPAITPQNPTPRILIQLSGDEGVDESEGLKTEEVHIHELPAGLETAHIFAVNYSDASKGNPHSFANYDGIVQVKDSSGEYDFGVPLSSTEPGYFAHIATLSGTGTLTRVNKVMGMTAEFFESIPAAKQLLA
jgi:hypothetical protein